MTRNFITAALLLFTAIAFTAIAHADDVAPPTTSAIAPSNSRAFPIREPASDAEQAAARKILAKRRAAHLKVLSAYADKGLFPQNISQPGLGHVFMDDNGVLCAVANLMSKSGSHDLVVRTAKDDNTVALSDVKGGALLSWMLTSGFTQAEIALIQRPGFRVINEPSFADLERQRLQANVAAISLQLEASVDKSLDAAVAELAKSPYLLRLMINQEAETKKS